MVMAVLCWCSCCGMVVLWCRGGVCGVMFQIAFGGLLGGAEARRVTQHTHQHLETSPPSPSPSPPSSSPPITITPPHHHHHHLEVGRLDQLRPLEALPDAHVLGGGKGERALELEDLVFCVVVVLVWCGVVWCWWCGVVCCIVDCVCDCVCVCAAGARASVRCCRPLAPFSEKPSPRTHRTRATPHLSPRPPLLPSPAAPRCARPLTSRRCQSRRASRCRSRCGRRSRT